MAIVNNFCLTSGLGGGALADSTYTYYIRQPAPGYIMQAF